MLPLLLMRFHKNDKAHRRERARARAHMPPRRHHIYFDVMLSAQYIRSVGRYVVFVVELENQSNLGALRKRTCVNYTITEFTILYARVNFKSISCSLIVRVRVITNKDNGYY